jgi:hypothetical protein
MPKHQAMKAYRWIGEDPHILDLGIYAFNIVFTVALLLKLTISWNMMSGNTVQFVLWREHLKVLTVLNTLKHKVGLNNI